jgi:thymidylate kinase
MLQRELFLRDLPDWKTIILDVDADIAMQRSGDRSGQERTHFDERKKDFHEAVRSGFQAYARDFPEARASIVDASGTIDEVFRNVLALVRAEIE